METQKNTEPLRNIIIITLISFYVLIVVISAWLSDDAYITFRTIDNFINGFGLTWNVSERVQVYTHPLWMFIISAFYFITREIYFTSISISILISTGAVLLLIYKLSNSITNTIFVSLILIFSKAFIDYSTSGLENPLTHLLIVVFFILYFKDEGGEKKLFKLSLIASLAVLNRIDIVLIFLPALLVIYFREDNKWKGLLIAIAGFSPFILWEVFSLFYYGFPFPNTAYAKLNTGIDQIELVQQGLHYLLFSFYFDPLTPIIIICALLIPMITRNRNLLPLSVGIDLYMVYIVMIGGDFMAGRFFSAPLLCSVIIFSRISLDKVRIKPFKSFIPQILSIIILGLLAPKPAIFSTSDYGLGPKIFKAFRFGPYITKTYHGIADERMWYYGTTGLLNNIFDKKIYLNSYVQDGLKSRIIKDSVIVEGIIGFFGYYSRNNLHIVDPLALADPLLGKLNAMASKKLKSNQTKKSSNWRIGHFVRKIPEGYIETLNSGQNKLGDPNLRNYYNKLSFIIRGNLFDFNRLIEIWNLNTGEYDYLVEAYNNRSLPNPD